MTTAGLDSMPCRMFSLTQERRDQRDEWCQDRSEDQEEQDEDEDGGGALHLVAGVTGLGLLVNLDRQGARQVHLHARRHLLRRDGGSQVADERRDRALVTLADVRKHLDLLRLPVGGQPQVVHLDDGGNLRQRRLQSRQPRLVQRPPGRGRDDGHRREIRGAERRGQIGRLLARRAGREEVAVVALRDAGE
ncbi:MAG: hypothetical protein ABSA93_23855 [Streptosporangiaceae bacterium]